jgi:sortase B
MNKTANRIVTALLIAVLLVSGFQLWRYGAAEKENEKQLGNISSQVQTPTASPEPPAEAAPPNWTVYEQYGALFMENADMIGWIKIDGTIIDYPVMQTPDRPDYYLKHGFDRQPSEYGVPYAAEGCAFDPQSDNVTVYAHHMKSGKMFGELEKYKQAAFWREHPAIRFDTFTCFGTYEIIAAFKVSPADFPYNQFINASGQAEFDEYVRRCKALSFYDTGITAEYGDRLLTLSTCEYSAEDGRLAVVAKKIET